MDDLDWNSVNHLYGSGLEVRNLLEKIWSESPAERVSAYEELTELLVGDGMASPAGVEAVPYLVDLVGSDNAPDRFAACRLLAAIAVGDDERWLQNRMSVTLIRAEVERMSGLTTEELLREKDAWVSAAPTDEERAARGRSAQFASVKAEREQQVLHMRSYDAVMAGVPTFIGALAASSSTLRLYAAYLLSWFPERAKLTESALARALVVEEDSEVAAVMCVSAGLACGPNSRLFELVKERARSHSRRERWASAMGQARLIAQPSRELIADLYDCVFARTRDIHNWPYVYGSMSATASLIAQSLSDKSSNERIEVIIGRLAMGDPEDDTFRLFRALLQAAFPSGSAPAGTPFRGLAAHQRKAMLAVARYEGLRKQPEINHMFRHFGLPFEHDSFNEWLKDVS
ncbi:hypothetical protein [Micromonospora sp. NPDC051296]|uniref:hypothetical protein n=1 Tax=Micromonospora sp. NPDC051296 TaxID=3155046 RepID=UPI003425318D